MRMSTTISCVARYKNPKTTSVDVQFSMRLLVVEMRIMFADVWLVRVELVILTWPAKVVSWSGSDDRRF